MLYLMHLKYIAYSIHRPMKLGTIFIEVLFYGTVLAPLTTFSLLQSSKKGFPISRKAP
jgi:hypothetical protein